jgi:hypothetical protein
MRREYFQMKSLVAVTLMLFLSACASTGRPGEATRTGARDAIATCAPGYVEYPFGSGRCALNEEPQQQAGPIRQTIGGAMSQPRPSLGGLRR